MLYVTRSGLLKKFSAQAPKSTLRDGQQRWRGPATVIGNDCSVYFLRHQGNLVWVSACRITETGLIEKESNDKKAENTDDTNNRENIPVKNKEIKERIW